MEERRGSFSRWNDQPVRRRMRTTTNKQKTQKTLSRSIVWPLKYRVLWKYLQGICIRIHLAGTNHTHTHTHTHTRTRAQKYINLKKEMRLVPCLLVQCPWVVWPASHVDTTTKSAEKDEVFRPARQPRADLTRLTLNSNWLQRGLTDHRRRIPGRICYYGYTRAKC